MLDQKKKQRIIAKFKTHENDTGSPEVQIAILTEEIKELTKHLQMHKQDHSSRRGLLKKLGERKRLLRYLEAENQESYENLIKELKLKISKKYQERKEEIARLLAEDEEAERAEEESVEEPVVEEE
ncbi:30S ribosomal protein S15 [Candidatus Falkowbacteria bacterium RIFOXYD2_FULL_35_9]|uniref:Small ribosomal subunit protein uS15 n=1 Tax=Candidatus Falkowbacteria bacterium RIFOXYC2_FULL_36_12 TaxID=1798002 RepID=A0A1F5T367_9BACT|nr:MAG: 30S ribosomal protein S15 [Candidatus Falkowbacteria bacterium RIFOXYC2_FULL_36_12]OGF33899.1 MAG: 30S ribosomal protein S15 [Candidatus Falkowbacteria bacterium RIFOXYA2_FULL_35_8]OGF45780.1 MAG: 30S ribosomal protein S15 [Candidatus Falkowbacteria bacterium RIFOXYD2_FULL_35_9]